MSRLASLALLAASLATFPALASAPSLNTQQEAINALLNQVQNLVSSNQLASADAAPLIADLNNAVSTLAGATGDAAVLGGGVSTISTGTFTSGGGYNSFSGGSGFSGDAIWQIPGVTIQNQNLATNSLLDVMSRAGSLAGMGHLSTGNVASLTDALIVTLQGWQTDSASLLGLINIDISALGAAGILTSAQVTDIQNKIQNIETDLSIEDSGDSESILAALDTEFTNYGNNGYLPSQVVSTLLPISTQIYNIETNGHPSLAAIKNVKSKVADMTTNGNLNSTQKQQLDALLNTSLYLTEDNDFAAIPALLSASTALLQGDETTKNTTSVTAAEALIADALPLVQGLIGPVLASGYQPDGTQGYGNVAPAVSVMFQDAFRAINPSSIQAALTGTTSTGVAVNMSLTSSLSLSSSNGGKTYQIGINLASLTLLDGSYSFSLNLSDTAGNEAAPFVSTFFLGRTAPVIQFGVQSGFLTDQALLNLPITVVAESPTVSTQISLNGTVVYTANSLSFNAPITLQQGTNTITAVAVDLVGNQSTAQLNNVTLDTSAPVITLGVADNEVQRSPAFVLPVSVSDSVAVTTTVTQNGAQIAQSSQASFSVTATLSPGTNSFVITSVDAAGNQISADLNSIILDAVGPVIVLGQSDNQLTNNSSFSLPVTVIDLFGVTTTILQNGFEVYQGTQSIFTANLTLTGGINVIQVTLVDQAGIQSTAQLNSITFDNTPPVLALGGSQNVYTHNPAFSLPVSVTDSLATTTTVYLNGSQVVQSQQNSFVASMTLQPGTNSIQAVSTDIAGNTATASLGTVDFDNIAPVITLGSPDNILTRFSAFSLPITSLDSLPTTTDVILNGVQVAQSSQVSFTASLMLQQGINVIQVNSTDEAGNQASAQLNDIFLNTIPPATSSLTPLSGTVITTMSFPVSGVASEPLQSVTLNGQPIKIAANQMTFSGNFTASASGPLNLNWVLTDLEGNVTNQTVAVEILLNVLNGNLLSVVPDPDNVHLDIIGAPGAAVPGITVSASASFLNNGTATANANGSFFIQMQAFQTATVSATQNGFENTATVYYGPGSGTFLAGTVKNTQGSPIAGVTVSIVGTSASTTTDGNGVFAFNPQNTSLPDGTVAVISGDRTLVINGTTSIQNGVAQNSSSPVLYSQTEVSVNIGLSQSNVISTPIYLQGIPNNGSVPVISASSGGTVTSSAAPGVSLTIPPNSATFPGSASAPVYAATVPVSYSTIPPLRFSVPNNVTILEPSGTQFSSPVQLTLPNVNHLAPGVQMVIMSMNSAQGTWGVDGVATVSADGQSVVTKPGQGITHFSVVYASPIGPTVSAIGAQDQPGADSFNGSVSTTVSLPSFKSLGSTVTPGLIYKSSWANPSVLVTNQFNIPTDEIDETSHGAIAVSLLLSTTTQTSTWYQPDHVTAQFSSGTLQYPAATFTGVPNQAVLSYSMNLVNPTTGVGYASGVYPYDSHYQIYLDEMVVGTITAYLPPNYGGAQIYQQSFSSSQALSQIFPSDLVGQMYVQNQSAAPEGRGWRITGPQRITNPGSSQLLLEEADGTISGYDANNTITTVFDPTTLGQSQNVDLTQGVDFNSWPNVGVTVDNGPEARSVASVNLSTQSPSLQSVTPITFKSGYAVGYVTGSSTCTIYKFPIWLSPKTTQFVAIPGGETWVGSNNMGTFFPVTASYPYPQFNLDSQSTASNPYSLIFANDLQTVEGWFQAADGNWSAFSNYLNYPTSGTLQNFYSPWQYANSPGQYVDPNPIGSTTVSGGAYNYSGDPNLTLNGLPEYCSGVMQPGTAVSQLSDSYGWTAAQYVLPQYLPQEPAIGGTESMGQANFSFPNRINTVPIRQVIWNSPMGVMPGPRSNTLVVADHGYNEIDLVDIAADTVTRVAGNGTNYDTGSGVSATTASIYHPRGAAYDLQGNLYISSDSGAIRMVDTTGTITFITQPSANTIFANTSPAINAQFNMPTGLVVDNTNGYLYVADTGNNRVVQINLQTQTANTVAGNSTNSFSGDNGPALSASLSGPTWLGLDTNNNLLIDDAGNKKIRRVIFNSNVSGSVIAYASTKPDSSTLIQNADGTFTRTLRNGTQSHFDGNGHQIATVDRVGRQSTFAYDGQGRMISATDPVGQTVQYNYFGNNLGAIIDPAGKMTGFTYDGSNNLVQVTFPDGSGKHYTYDQNGLMLSETDQSARTTQYAYNQWGRVQQVTKADGSTMSFQDMGSATAGNNYTGGTQGAFTSLGTGPNQVFDGIVDSRSVTTTFVPNTGGYITAVIDGNGNTTNIQRDQYGNPLLIQRPDGTTVTFVYDPNTLDLISQTDTATGITTAQSYDPYGHIVASINGRGYTSAAQFDPNTGNLLTTADPLGHGMNYVYNGVGLPLSAKNSLGIGATLSYDNRGNPISVTYSGGHTTTRTFDASGNVTSVTNADAQTTSYAYDAFDRLLSVTSPKGEVTQYSYLPTGELAQFKDPLGNTVSFLYSPLGQVVQKTDALGYVTKRSYDGNGNVLQEVDPNGNIKNFAYDNINRLVQKALPDDTISLSYDVRNNLLQLTNSVSSLSFTYDDASRMIASQAQGRGSLNGMPSTHLTYAWDSGYNRVQMVDPVGVSNYAYDQADRPVSITNPFGENYAFVADAGNRLTSISRPGSQTAIGYDNSSLLASIVHAAGGNPIASYSLQHDNIGALTQLTTQTNTRTFSYDPDSQLTSASNPETSIASMQTESFSYDARSNRTQDQGGSYGYDTRSVRLVQDYRFTYIYDNNGNLISKQEVGSGVGTDGLVGEVTNYTYSSQNQLMGFKVYSNGITSSTPNKVVAYFYDGLGRRVSKQVSFNGASGTNTVTRNYAYDGSKILLEYDGNNTLLARYTHRNGVDGAMAVAITSAGANAGLAQAQGTYLYLTDQIGSIIDVTDNNGNRIQHYVYSAFGERLQILNGTGTDVTSSPPVRTSYEFAGREWDWESGLMYMRARYYDPASGRFLQQDPSAGAVSSPISVINPYVYAANSPSNLTDPSGLSFFGSLFSAFVDPFTMAASVSLNVASMITNVVTSREFVAAVLIAAAVVCLIVQPELAPVIGDALSVAVYGAAAGTVFGAAGAVVVGGIDGDFSWNNVIEGEEAGAATGFATGGATGYFGGPQSLGWVGAGFVGAAGAVGGGLAFHAAYGDFDAYASSPTGVGFTAAGGFLSGSGASSAAGRAALNIGNGIVDTIAAAVTSVGLLSLSPR